jgi:hypothetical protein
MLRPLLVVLLVSVPALAQSEKAKADPDQFAEIVHLLHNKTVKLDTKLKGATLRQMLESLDAQLDKKMRFVVREDLFRALGPDYENIMEKQFLYERLVNAGTLHEVLVNTLPDVGAAFLVRKNHIEITIHASIWEHFDETFRLENDVDLKSLATGMPRIPLVSAVYKEKPLADALDELSKHYDRTIVLSGHTPEQAKKPVSARLMNVPLPLAVRILARNADLHVIESGQTLIVTTEKEAKLFRPKPVKAKAVEK